MPYFLAELSPEFLQLLTAIVTLLTAVGVVFGRLYFVARSKGVSIMSLFRETKNLSDVLRIVTEEIEWFNANRTGSAEDLKRAIRERLLPNDKLADWFDDFLNSQGFGPKAKSEEPEDTEDK